MKKDFNESIEQYKENIEIMLLFDGILLSSQLHKIKLALGKNISNKNHSREVERMVKQELVEIKDREQKKTRNTKLLYFSNKTCKYLNIPIISKKEKILSSQKYYLSVMKADYIIDLIEKHNITDILKIKRVLPLLFFKENQGIDLMKAYIKKSKILDCQAFNSFLTVDIIKNKINNNNSNITINYNVLEALLNLTADYNEKYNQNMIVKNNTLECPMAYLFSLYNQCSYNKEVINHNIGIKKDYVKELELYKLKDKDYLEDLLRNHPDQIMDLCFKTQVKRQEYKAKLNYIDYNHFDFNSLLSNRIFILKEKLDNNQVFIKLIYFDTNTSSHSVEYIDRLISRTIDTYNLFNHCSSTQKINIDIEYRVKDPLVEEKLLKRLNSKSKKPNSTEQPDKFKTYINKNEFNDLVESNKLSYKITYIPVKEKYYVNF